METLRAYGVLVKIVDTVNMMYTNTTVKVLSPDRNTQFFKNSNWSSQGRYAGIISIHYCLGLRHETSSRKRKQSRIHSR